MTESIKIADIIVEYTDDEGGKTKILVVLNESVSTNLGEILDITEYKEKIKKMLIKNTAENLTNTTLKTSHSK